MQLQGLRLGIELATLIARPTTYRGSYTSYIAVILGESSICIYVANIGGKV